jgi:leucyl aminopeptidase
VIVGVYESRKLTFAADLLDRISNGFISDVIRRGDMEGKLGSTLILHSVPHTLCDRVMLVGLGKERDFRAKEYREAVRSSVRSLTQTSATEAVSYLTELTVKKHDVEWMIEQATVVTLDVLYRFDRFKSKQDDGAREPRKLTWPCRGAATWPMAKGLLRGLAIGNGMKLAKDLGNLPPNVCTPAYLAEEAERIAAEFGTGGNLRPKPAGSAWAQFLPVGRAWQRGGTQADRAALPGCQGQERPPAGAGGQGHHV